MKNAFIKYQTPEFKAWFYDRSQFVLSIAIVVAAIGVLIILAKLYPNVFMVIITAICLTIGCFMALAIAVAYWCHILEKRCSPSDKQIELERAHYEHWYINNN